MILLQKACDFPAGMVYLFEGLGSGCRATRRALSGNSALEVGRLGKACFNFL